MMPRAGAVTTSSAAAPATRRSGPAAAPSDNEINPGAASPDRPRWSGTRIAATTRAVNRLSELGLARRKTDEADCRSVFIQRTVKGSMFLREFGELIVSAANAGDADNASGLSPG